MLFNVAHNPNLYFNQRIPKNIEKSEKTIQSKIDDIPITIKQDETKLLIFNKADEIIY